MTHSQILNAITGVLLIEKGGEPKLVCIEDLGHAKHFSIGQLFNAIRVLNNKEVTQYGDKWPKSNVGDVASTDWEALKSAYADSETDLEFLYTVCEQLGEEMPTIVDREKVQENLDLYRRGALVIE